GCGAGRGKIRASPDARGARSASGWASAGASRGARGPGRCAMRTSEAVAELTTLLSCVTTDERAGAAVERALLACGLAWHRTLDSDDMGRLLAALAMEGGAIEQIAVQIALDGIDATSGGAMPDPTDRSAA